MVTETTQVKAKGSFLNSFKNLGLQKLLALSALVILYVFFGIFGQNFATSDTLVSILNSSYYTGFMALGTTFVIITGGIDLSMGTVMMGSALIGGVAYNVWHLPIAMALLIVVLSGTLFGLLNGLLIAKLGLPPFIATLGTQFGSLGLCSVIANVQTQSYPAITDKDGWFKSVFFKTESGFPTGIIWLAIFFLIAFILLNKTRMGRYTFAIGSNEEAARLSGINTGNWKILVYTFAGLYSGIAGVLYAATYTSIVPQTGNGLEMYAIAACVIGGTSLAGGIGSLAGTVIGVFVITVLKNGLMSMGLQVKWQTFFIGVVVILAVLLDIYRNKQQNKVKKA